ncbi:molybdopterin converting factor subunit 1 [Neiella holothuriorum]|nr:molybdopterin converting factor subunit 1 [Neiella holothuriorum]
MNVLLFASLREAVGQETLAVDIALPCRVEALKQHIADQHPSIATAQSNQALLVAVNQMIVGNEHQVEEGDEVAFFPPVTGG